MKYLLFACCVLNTVVVYTQQKATVKEYKKVFTTYPYSDPSPVPDPAAKIYPYYRYDGFTNTGIQREWKVVELENDYITVMIMPEAGGKIWTATEKKTGKDFLYNNHVVKFRDVAMRGPWTSGGIEANYGIIGHTPNCATPVDYTTMQKDDGSVSCIIGVLDLLTQTQWRLEINLPADKAYFTTASFWYNGTPLEQPYYTWMNTGIKAKGNLEFIYPGTHYLGHEGEYSEWPVNKSNGKKISFYNENDFGGYKSYHVFGIYTDFFGGYWHNDGYGMARYSTHDDKAGKKIWIWGLSQQGMIWEKLLSDTDGQYVEVQSGRLFNQSAESSLYTPFKFKGFSANETDKWTEYWFPVLQTKGFVKANASGALNAVLQNGWLKIHFCPVQAIDDDIIIFDGLTQYKKHVILKPLETYADSVHLPTDESAWTVTVGNKISYSSKKDSEAALSRPIQSPADFDWNSVYGLYVAGRSLMEQRWYIPAEEKILTCLQKDKNYAPALIALSELEYRKMNYGKAFEAASKALAVNTYDAAANYYYGLAARKMQKAYDAKDGFDIAAQSAAYRVPAYTQLAYIYFAEKAYDKAVSYAVKSLEYNAGNIDAMQLLAVIYSNNHNDELYEETLKSITKADPLNHFVAFQQYFLAPTDANKTKFLASIQNEMPAETCMQLAAWYYNIGRSDEVKSILVLSPAGWETNIWRQYFSMTEFNNGPSFTPSAFPFRSETAEILEAMRVSDKGWKLSYALALIHASRNNTAKAAELFTACANEPDNAAFYAARASLITDTKEKDLLHAISLDKEQWRYHKMLAELYIQQQQYEKALAVAEAYYPAHNANYIIGMLYAKTLLLNKAYGKCDTLLSKLQVIPFEGATDGRELYRETKLMLAAAEMERKNYKKALKYIADARLWPEQLGVGKPYDEDIDARLENWMEYTCYLQLKKNKDANAALQQIIAFTPGRENTVSNFLPASHLVSAWAIEKTQDHAAALQWLNGQIKQYPAMKRLLWSRDMFENKNIPPSPDTDANMRVLYRLM